MGTNDGPETLAGLNEMGSSPGVYTVLIWIDGQIGCEAVERQGTWLDSLLLPRDFLAWLNSSLLYSIHTTYISSSSSRSR